MLSPISELVMAALGKIPLTLLIRNANVLNVYTGEIVPSSIGIYKDTIVYVGNENDTKFDASEIIHAKGATAIPGLIDTHLHIESTMVIPSIFAEAVLPRGTTTVCADPHEIANVLGKDGVRMMVDNAKNLLMKIFFFAPTCVPESAAVTAGADISPAELEEMLDWEGIVGLGEVMDYEGVLASNPKMIEILEIGRRKNVTIDGHCPLLSGAKLNAYIATGPEADHENFIVDQALEKLRAGLCLKLRGPDILDTKGIVSALAKLPKPSNIILCTDDVMPDRLIDSGHLDEVCRSVIAAGMDPVDAIRSATLTPAQHLRMLNIGAIAPGKLADILLIDNLKSFGVVTVFSNGVKVAEDGRLTVKLPHRPFPNSARKSIHVQTLTSGDFKLDLPLENGTINVNAIDFAPYIDQTRSKSAAFLEMILTKLVIAKIEVKNSEIVSKDTAIVMLFERHGKSRAKATGIVRNLIRSGAIATTVAHDAHNLLVVGTNPDDMLHAARLVIQSGGGIVAVKDAKNLAQIELPIAGLMSEEPVEKVAEKMRNLRIAFKEMGMIDHPYMPIACLLTLSVIPHARITDKGIYDVDSQRFVDLIAR